MGYVLAKLFNRYEETKLLLAGLDSVGKTTIVYQLKRGEIVTTIPTIGCNVDTLQVNGIYFTVWDVGGPDIMRPLLRRYFDGTKALIYVIDSNDHERFSQAAEEFKSIAQADDMRDVVILIFANKQDLPNAKSPMVISEALQLHKLRQHCHIIPTVAATGEGLTEGLGWIAEILTRKHLPKDSEEIVKLKEYKHIEKKNEIWSYFKQSWTSFYSLFVDPPETRVVLLQQLE